MSLRQPALRATTVLRFFDAGPLAYVTLALLIAAGTYFMVSFLGMKFFVIALGGLVALPVLAKYSYRDISIILSLWVFSMSGFKVLALVSMPGLPDFSPDRAIMIWLVITLFFRFFIGRDEIVRPLTIDAILIVHTVYILLSILFRSPGSFHAWVLSNLSPLFAFLYGKHAVKREVEIRNMLYFFLAISVYYYVTSIAEHFHWNQLIWPKAILDPNMGHLWHPGRSRGPIMHPPLFGQLQAMFLLVHFYFLVRRGPLWTKIVLSISLIFSFLGLLFAYTRAPWVATGVALLTLAVIRPNYRKIMGILALLAVLAGVLGVLQMANSPFLQERLHTEGTFENRLAFLATSLNIIRDHPVFGVGYFRAKDYIWQYNTGHYFPFYGYVKKHFGTNMVPHDIYLGRTADEGLVSTLLLLAFTVLTLRIFIKKWHANPQSRWFNRNLLALFAAIAVCYWVGGMGIDYRYFDLVNVIFFLIAGIVTGYRNKEFGIA